MRVCVGNGKGREKDRLGVCRLYERNREMDRVGVCVCILCESKRERWPE